MSSSSSTDDSVAWVVEAGRTVQDYVQSLVPKVTIESFPAGEGWTLVECDELDVLDGLKEEFKKEFRRSRKVFWNHLDRDQTLTSQCIIDA